MEEAASERHKAFAAGHRSVKIVRLTSPLPDVLRLSLPRLRHSRRLALLSRLNLCTLFFVLSLALLPHVPFALTSLTVRLPGSRLRSSPTTQDLNFLSPSQRPCLAEPEATFPSSHSSFCSFFYPAKHFAAATNLSSSMPPAQKKLLLHAKAPSSLWHRFSPSRF